MNRSTRSLRRLDPGHAVTRVLGLALVVGLVGGTMAMVGFTGAQEAGPVTHVIEGREECSQCHSMSGPLALPATHQGRTDETCLMCHQPAEAGPSETPKPTATLVPQPTATPGGTATPEPVGEVTPEPTAVPTVTPTPRPTLVRPAATPTPPPSPSQGCLMCHGATGLTREFPSGDVMPLSVSAALFRESVHGGVLECQDCHRGYEELPHLPMTVESYREYTLAQYEVCKRCHFANYTKTLDSMHYEALSMGNPQAPVCTDCHGAHHVTRPDQPRARIPQTCSQCHSAIYETYLRSVHGTALVSEGNPDVPTCTYCHGVHNIHDPRTSSFRLDIPQLCGSCHADEGRMARYGLSTNVLSTYLHDFHGVTVTLAGEGEPGIQTYEAVCTDCHGIHDIVAADSPDSPVIKANLVETCRQCHSGATENFPSAWLSHYEPSLGHAPLVFLLKMFYRIFIPVVVIGLLIQVGLNLWRWAINR